jgi:endonuclease III
VENQNLDVTNGLQSGIVNQMDLEQLAATLERMGCPQQKSAEMAAQLDKRARQLSEQKGRSYEDAMAHLLELMAKGWAANANR